MQNKLNTYRTQIDTIDSKITALLNQRALIAKKIGLYKKENNLPFFNKKRNQEVFLNVLKENNFPLKALKKIYTIILKEMVKLEKKL